MDIVHNRRIQNRLYRGGELSPESWNLADKPAAYIMLDKNDIYCPLCETWGKYMGISGRFIFPPHGYKYQEGE